MGKRKRKKINLTHEDKLKLQEIARKRTAPIREIVRAKIILMYSSGEKISKIAKKLDTNRPLVERCIDKALAYGVLESLQDLPRKGRPHLITDNAKTWVLNIACIAPKDLGYAAETWTYSLLIKYIKNNYKEAEHECLKNIGKSLLNNILSKGNIKPHKISYYLEKRDPDFEEKMAVVLNVYKEVEIINMNKNKDKKITTISYDEKPGIQAIKNISAQLLPIPGQYNTISRDYEYKRLGTLSLLAGIDLHNGGVIPIVRERHRSKEFIEFLEKVDKEYPEDWKIRLILDNHSSHTSKETKQYLLSKPDRFEFIFTPKHGSWLNIVEVFFSKIARSFLKHIRVDSKKELIERIYKGIEEINKDPVIFRWKYKMAEMQ